MDEAVLEDAWKTTLNDLVGKRVPSTTGHFIVIDTKEQAETLMSDRYSGGTRGDQVPGTDERAASFMKVINEVRQAANLSVLRI